MIDIQHKILESIKDNLDNIDLFFKDKDKLEKIMRETKTIASWDSNDKIRMYQVITEEIFNKYDINEIIQALINFGFSKEEFLNIELFKAVVYEYYLFLKKVYDIYLLDQIYYLLKSDIDFATYTFDKAVKTGSYFETANFDVSFRQISFNRNNEDVDIHLYNIKEYYLKLINDLLQDKRYLLRKAYLNKYLDRISRKSNNYYALKLYISLNTFIKPARIQYKKTSKSNDDEMQLVLKLM